MRSPKSSSPNRGPRKPRTARLSVRGLHALPDGLTPDDIEWEDAPSVIAALEQRWAKWRKQKDILDRDWLKASRERVAAAAQLVGEDKLKIALDTEEEKRRVYFVQDAEENAQYVAALSAAIKKSADARSAAWLASARARLARATRAINADTNRRDRELLARKRR
jgi:hypothetical protein